MRMNAVTLELSIDEANLVLEALGGMPFARVYTLVAKIQQQAQSQVQEAGRPGAPGPEARLPANGEPREPSP
jgi:hypothetical protein